MRLFLDANILFSAAKSQGAVRRFLATLRAQGHSLVADGYVIGEAQRNLEAKFPPSVRELESLLLGVEVAVKVAAPLAPELCPELPQKDRPVLAAAILNGCDGLLTGDKTHFASLYGKTVTGVTGVTIQSPASLAQRSTPQ